MVPGADLEGGEGGEEWRVAGVHLPSGVEEPPRLVEVPLLALQQCPGDVGGCVRRGTH